MYNTFNKLNLKFYTFNYIFCINSKYPRGRDGVASIWLLCVVDVLFKQISYS